VVETYKQHQIVEVEARKHARDAELTVASSRLTVAHMLKVCEAMFDGKTAKSLRELAESLGLDDGGA
jgi:hypothetical protein